MFSPFIIGHWLLNVSTFCSPEEIKFLLNLVRQLLWGAFWLFLQMSSLCLHVIITALHGLKDSPFFFLHLAAAKKQCSHLPLAWMETWGCCKWLISIQQQSEWAMLAYINADKAALRFRKLNYHLCCNNNTN